MCQRLGGAATTAPEFEACAAPPDADCDHTLTLELETDAYGYETSWRFEHVETCALAHACAFVPTNTYGSNRDHLGAQALLISDSVCAGETRGARAGRRGRRGRTGSSLGDAATLRGDEASRRRCGGRFESRRRGDDASWRTGAIRVSAIPRTIRVAAGSSSRTIHVVAAVAPRRVSTKYPRRGGLVPTDYPRRGRGVAATRLHGLSAQVPVHYHRFVRRRNLLRRGRGPLPAVPRRCYTKDRRRLRRERRDAC